MWEAEISLGLWWAGPRRSSREWVIPSPLLLVTLPTTADVSTWGPGRPRTAHIYFRLKIILVWRMLLLVWSLVASVTWGDGGIVVMQDNTDTHHLLSAISVWPHHQTPSSVRVRYINNIQSTFTVAWEEILENIGKYFVVLFFISHADNQRALHITLNDYKMDEIIIVPCLWCLHCCIVLWRHIWKLGLSYWLNFNFYVRFLVNL